jgi:signal transduction histidine kinase
MVMIGPPRWSPRRRRLLGEVLFVVVVVGVDLLVWGDDRELWNGGLLPVWIVPVTSAAAGATLLLRWRHPVPVAAAEWGYALVNLALPGYYPFAPLLVALHAVASRCSTGTARLVLLAAAVPFGLFSWRSGGSGSATLQAAAVWVVVVGVVWGLGRLSYAAARRARDERERLAREAERAVEAERLRLARELHDSVTGAVTAMIMHAAGARAHLAATEGTAHRALRTVEEAGVQAMNELHRMLGLLRAPDDGVVAEASLAELDALVERSRQGGADVVVTALGTRGRLDPSVDLAAYRIVQESLTNAAKYAGPDARIEVCLDWRPDDLHLDVRSAGAATAAPVPSSGLGLVGLRERVHIVGGRFDAGPTVDGWLVHTELPRSGRAGAAS